MPNRENPAHGEPRPPHRPRRLLPRARDGAARTCTSAPCCVFEGAAPAYDEFVAHDRAAAAPRPALPPEARVPAARRRRGPVWVDDPHFNAALPRAPHRAARARGRGASCAALAGRVFSQQLDRSKPLWEMWLVDRVGDDRFALISKTHHALVDGISGVDITTVLFDLEPDPPEPEPGAAVVPAARAEPRRRCSPTRWPSARAAPLDAARGALRRRSRIPSARSPAAARAVAGLAAMAAAGLGGAPPSPLNVPHRPAPALRLGRRPTSTRFKAIKAALGGTVNDVVLDRRRRRAARAPDPPRRATPRAWSSRRWCRSRCAPTPSAARSATGSRRCTRRCRSALEDPVERFRDRARGDGRPEGVRPGGRRRGAHAARRLRARRRCSTRPRGCSRASASSTSTVTNVPGPAVPALHAGPPAARVLPAGAAGAQHGARDRDHVLRRAARSSGCSATTTRCPTSTTLAADLERGDRRARGGRRRAGERRAPQRPRRPRGAPDARPPRRERGAARRRSASSLVAGGVVALLLVVQRARRRRRRRRAPRGPGRAAARPRRAPPRRPASTPARGSPTRRRAARTTPRLSTRDGRADRRPDPARARARRRGDPLRRAAPAGGAARAAGRRRGPFDAELAAAGQAVILAAAPGAGPVDRARLAAAAARRRPGRPAAARVRRGLARPRRCRG